MMLVDAPSGLDVQEGTELANVPVINSPDTAKTGCAYLFPTLSHRSDGGKEYLLGVFADALSKPESVVISVVVPSASGMPASREVRLPVHRGQAFHGRYDNNAPSWSLTLEPVPVLTIRSFVWGNETKNMLASAVALRDLPVVVVDLRGNGGGNFSNFTQWLAQFSKHTSHYAGVAQMQFGQTDPLRKWDCLFEFPGSLMSGSIGRSDTPYRGRLFVLMDKDSASASEHAANIAGQMPGAVVVGENTSGVYTYANDMYETRLPNSGLVAESGSGKNGHFVRQACEGVGVFPDYWLDESDPVAAIAAYCSLK